jgi:hypothetical protein
MKRVLVPAAVVAACLTIPFQGSAAGPPDAVCPQDTYAFSGTARDLIVPAGGWCDVTDSTVLRDLVVHTGAGVATLDTTIGRDLLVGPDGEANVAATGIGHDLLARSTSALHLERTTIGHDLVAQEPQTVQTGRVDRDTPGGPVRVAHDVLIKGSPDLPFVFDGICALDVGHDLRIARRSVTLGMGIGDQCAGSGRAANTIAHDLIVTDNSALVGFFGPSALEVGGNHVGHDLVFRRNTAAPGGYLEVADNVVGHDAICIGNDPAVSKDAGDGPNVVGHTNSCG